MIDLDATCIRWHGMALRRRLDEWLGYILDAKAMSRLERPYL